MGFRAPALVGACGDKKAAAPTTGTTPADTSPAPTTEPTTTEPQTTSVAVTPPPPGTGGAKAVAAYKA